MTEKTNRYDKEEIYAALKLIENLYKQGYIKKHIFRNIMLDYKGVIDISEFRCYN